MRLLSVITALLVPSVVLAVFADEAYQIDYHHALLGIPQEDNTFVHQPVASSKASLLYTHKDKSLLGAVNPKDGSIVWRQQVHSAVNSSAAVLRAGNDGDVVATGTDGQVAAWAASDGRLIWSHDFAEKAQIKDVKFLELKGDGSTTGAKDVLVLYLGSQAVVERRDADTGDLKWSFTDARYVPHVR
jgi:outer membrane protein assembly factor BamB